MVEPRKDGTAVCRCPYCDVVVEEENAICVACKVVIIECVNCGEPVRNGAATCSNCGKPPR